MIPRSAVTWQAQSWQKIQAQAVRDPAELLTLLALPPALLPAARAASVLFPLCVPRGYVARMEPGNPDDPLLRQVLPLDLELHADADALIDPVGDLSAMVRPGLLHKYPGRALLVTTGACGVHCRYCFRRHFPYRDANPATDAWESALAYLREDDSIHEVILSGGDPLTLNDHRLAALGAHLAGIDHIKRLRIHTRQPIVLPERVDDALLTWLTDCPLQTVIVVHTNHARELNTDVREALARLRAIGVELLNQSVLLRGVNDEPDTLAELSEALFASGVLPYYLHQLDRVQGAGHFAVADEQARALIDALRARLSGYLVPRLVREIPGGASKIPLS